MTTVAVSDVFAAEPAAAAPAVPQVAVVEGGGVQTRGRASLTLTHGDAKSWMVGAFRTVRGDITGAWPWMGSPPTLRDLWADRMPSLDRVPGSNRALHAGWVAWNHAALVPTAVLSTVLWLLQHPARTLLGLALLTPLLITII